MEKFDFKQILENKPLFYTIIGCAVACGVMLILMIFTLASVHNSQGSNNLNNQQDIFHQMYFPYR